MGWERGVYTDVITNRWMIHYLVPQASGRGGEHVLPWQEGEGKDTHVPSFAFDFSV